MGLLDDVSIDIDCPVCKKNFEITLQEVGSTVQCPYCHTDIELKDNGLSNELENVESLIDNLF